jgi:hypothetical protein
MIAVAAADGTIVRIPDDDDVAIVSPAGSHVTTWLGSHFPAGFSNTAGSISGSTSMVSNSIVVT